ncbi:MAG: DUF748 domain-containing protein [Burkholderiales bacterium]|nr:DUF748 domain-containing protein [Burkholderiales bacterium]
MLSARSRRILKIAGLVGVAGALAVLCLSLFVGPLLDLILERVNRGFPGTVTVRSARLDGRVLAFQNLTLSDPDGRPVLQVPRGTLTLHPLRMLRQAHWIGLLGDLALEEPFLRVEVAEDGRLNLARLLPPPRPGARPLLPECSGTLQIRGGSIHFEDQRGAGFHYQLRDWEGSLALRRGQQAQVDLVWVPVQEEPGRLAVTGRLDPVHPRFDLNLDLQAISLRRLGEHPRLNEKLSLHGGLLQARLWASCDAVDWRDVFKRMVYGGNLALTRGEAWIPGLLKPIRQIEGRADLVTGVLSLREFRANLAGMGATTRGKVFLPPQSRLDLLAVVPRLRAEPMGEALGQFLPLEGEARLEIALTGGFSTIRAEGRIKSERLVLQDQTLRQAEALFETDGNLLTLREVRARSGAGSLEGGGLLVLGPEASLVLTLNGNQTSLSGLSPVGGEIGSFDLSVLGSARQPVVLGSGRGIGGFQGEAGRLSQVSGRFLYHDGDVLVMDVLGALGGGSFRVPYALYDLKDPHVWAMVSTSGVELPSLRLGGLGQLSGRIRGQVQLEGIPTDLDSMSAFGLSQGTELSLNGLTVSALQGAVGLRQMQLMFPDMVGQAAGGSLQAAGWIGLAGGSSNLLARGSGAELSRLLGVLDRPLPLPIDLTGTGDFLFKWTSEGRGHPNWVHMLAESQGGGGHGPYQVAGYGFLGPRGLGAVAWMDGLPLARRRLTRDLELGGNLRGVAAAWGSLRDYEFAYRASLDGSPVAGVQGDRLRAFGEGRIRGPEILLGENVLSWDYQRRARTRAGGQNLRGRSWPWFGPVLASDLQSQARFRPPLPERGSLKVTGSYLLGPKPEYELDYVASGIDLAWLTRQDWVPQAGQLAASLNLRAGQVHSTGHITADQGLPRLQPGSVFEAPWLLVGPRDPSRYPEIFSAVGRVWMGPNQGGRPGRIHLDPILASHEPADPRLVMSALDAVRRGEELGEGIFSLAGSLEGLSVDLAVSGRGWNLSDVLAFAPAAAKWPSNLLTGRLQVEDLQVRGNLGSDFLSNLDLTGRLALLDGFIEVLGYPIPVDRMSASLVRQHGDLVLEDMQVDSGELHLDGTGTRDASGRWTADLWTENFPLRHLHYLGPPFTRLSGGARMAVFLDSGNVTPSLVLGLEGHDVAWQAEPHAVEFPRLSLGRLETSQQGNPSTRRGLGIEMAFAGDRLHLDIPEGAVEVLARRAGEQETSAFSARGALSVGLGPVSDALGWFSGPAGPDFGVQGEPFRLQARDLDGDLLMALAGLKSSRRRFTFSGDLALMGQWHRDHGPSGRPGLPDYDLSVSRLEMGQKIEDSWAGLALERVMEVGYRHEGLEGRLVVEPFQMLPHLPAGQCGMGQVEGRADLVLARAAGAGQEDSNVLELRARSVPMLELGFLAPGMDRLGRVEDFLMSLSGPLLAPDFKLAWRLVDGALGPLQMASFAGQLKGGPTSEDGGYELRLVGDDGGPARLFFGPQASPQQTIELSAALPLRIQPGPEPAPGRLAAVWTGARVGAGGGMNLRARLIDSGMRLLDDLVPGVSASAGKLEGELAFSGTLDRPTLEGRLEVENGTVVHDLLGTFSALQVRTLFEEIPAEQAEPTLATLAEDTVVSRLSIETFQGKLGGVPFTVQGKAEMAGLEPVHVDVSLKGEALPLAWGDLFQGLADVQVDLVARPGRLAGQDSPSLIPVLTGTVDVQKGDMNLPLAGFGDTQGAGNQGRLPVDYRVRVNLGEDVWVHALGSRIRAQGELWVLPHQDTNMPVLAGSVDLSRGVLSVPFYAVSFRVRQGRATFESSLLPTLENVEAETQVAGHEITAVVSGTYPDLRMGLVSNPPLAEARIHQLLAVGGLAGYMPGVSGPESGRPDAGMTGNFVTGQGLTMATQFLAAPLSREIGRLLFLTDFTFEFLPPYNFVLKVAKALDNRDRFLLTLTQVMRSGGNQGRNESLYGLEWRLQRHLLTRFAFDDLGQMRLWFQGFLDFW